MLPLTSSDAAWTTNRDTDPVFPPTVTLIGTVNAEPLDTVATLLPVIVGVELDPNTSTTSVLVSPCAAEVVTTVGLATLIVDMVLLREGHVVGLNVM
jgi:hypothetical protein